MQVMDDVAVAKNGTAAAGNQPAVRKNADTASLLVVEDNPLTGQLLARWLHEKGYAVTLCADGDKALELVAEQPFDLVLLDVGVPGADGFEVLHTIRLTRPATMLPVVMATALGQSEMVVSALELGANDYVTKPYDPAVLLARVQTHLSLKRMVEQRAQLERSLAERNDELEQANRRMKAGLQAAAKVQEDLLPPAGTQIPGVRLAWSFRPCEDLAGDTLNVFALDNEHVGLYLLDVSGHGVPAALLSVHLSLMLSPARDPSSFLVRDGVPVPPAEAVGALNRRFTSSNTERFFTLFYGVLNRETGKFRYACAGHPGPVHVSGGSGCRVLPPSGPPVGMWEMQYAEHELDLKPGDRLYLYSDGITEAADEEGQLYGAERLTETILGTRDAPLEEGLAALMGDVDAWSGGQVDDDLSVLAVEFTGAVAD